MSQPVKLIEIVLFAKWSDLYDRHSFKKLVQFFCAKRGRFDKNIFCKKNKLRWRSNCFALGSLWPGGFIICSIIGHLQQWNLPNSIKNCQSGFNIFPNTKWTQNCLIISLNFAIVAKFRQSGHIVKIGFCHSLNSTKMVFDAVVKIILARNHFLTKW